MVSALPAFLRGTPEPSDSFPNSHTVLWGCTAHTWAGPT